MPASPLRLLGDHPVDHHRLHGVQPDRLAAGGGVRLRQQVVGRVLVGVRDDQPGRREHDHRDVPADLVVVEGGFVVHQEVEDRLVDDRGDDAAITA